jgi:outer membrane protein assembly factor BamB
MKRSLGGPASIQYVFKVTWNEQRKAHLLAVLAFALPITVESADWPQFRGPNRDSVWRETGILQAFPAGGLKVCWRAAVGPGFSSPVVAKGRVFITDSELEKPQVRERIHCFDEQTGKALWTYRDSVDYSADTFELAKQGSPPGPCPTPIVKEGRIFTLGATGHLLCLDAQNGALNWKRNLSQDYDLIDSPNLTSCPLIEGHLLIVVIGGKPGACVVAFNRRTGSEVWRALNDPPRAFSSPIVINAGGKRQLIVSVFRDTGRTARAGSRQS